MRYILACGVGTDHPNGYIFRSLPLKKYLFMHFKTPFFYEVGGIRTEGNAGDCLLHAPGSIVVHGPISNDKSFINDWVYFDSCPKEILPLPFDTLLKIPGDKVFSSRISVILEERLRNDAFSYRLQDDTIYRILVMIKRTVAQSVNDNDMLRAQFNKIRIEIIGRYKEHWTLQEMAKLSGYSVSRFCFLWTEFFGKSPIDDLLDERFEVAKSLLELHTFKIGDIAALCGFSSIHYFSKFFKKRTGRSPNSF